MNLIWERVFWFIAGLVLMVAAAFMPEIGTAFDVAFLDRLVGRLPIILVFCAGLSFIVFADVLGDLVEKYVTKRRLWK